MDFFFFFRWTSMKKRHIVHTVDRFKMFTFTASNLNPRPKYEVNCNASEISLGAVHTEHIFAVKTQ